MLCQAHLVKCSDELMNEASHNAMWQNNLTGFFSCWCILFYVIFSALRFWSDNKLGTGCLVFLQYKGG